MKMFDFLVDRGEKVILEAIDQPPAEFASAEEIFSKVLGHEKKVTGLVNKLYALSKEVDDNASSVFLHWFIDEQVEEEKNATQILGTIKMIKGEAVPLIMLDRELAKREG
jgi:ferritin